MERGDLVCIEGYEVCADITYAEEAGNVVVVHNNSSHILVLRKDGNDPDYGMTGAQFTFLAAFPYYQTEHFSEPYKLALDLAVKEAVRR